MPAMPVHRKYAQMLGLDSKMCSMIDSYIDRVKRHRFGNFTVGETWSTSELLNVAELFYERFGESGLRVFVLHHTLDAICRLLHSGRASRERVLVEVSARLDELARGLSGGERELCKLLTEIATEVRGLLEREGEELLEDIAPGAVL